MVTRSVHTRYDRLDNEPYHVGAQVSMSVGLGATREYISSCPLRTWTHLPWEFMTAIAVENVSRIAIKGKRE